MRCDFLRKLILDTGAPVCYYILAAMQKYPRGRRGSPAKGVGVYKAREGSNPSFCAMIYPLRKQGINHIILLFFKKPFVFQRSKFQSVLLKNSISEYGELPKRS